MAHSKISTLNRSQVLSENNDKSTASNTTYTDINSKISKLKDDSESSPLQNLLFQLEALDLVCLSLMYLLITQIVFKFHFNKSVNNIYIWLMLLILILTLAFSAYTYNDLYTNLDSYVYTYINFRK